NSSYFSSHISNTHINLRKNVYASATSTYTRAKGYAPSAHRCHGFQLCCCYLGYSCRSICPRTSEEVILREKKKKECI
ncbi:hypothetical protein K501DRAFT_28748, partial [Backusella circina FSU 941]